MFKLNLKNLSPRKCLAVAGLALLIAFISFLGMGFYLQNQLKEIYEKQSSQVFQDRKGEIIFIQPNEKGYWAQYLNRIPPQFKKLLIQKEDKYFYYHFGFNPWSIFQASLGYIGLGPKRASSTISQQLVKILLGKELERNLKNKIIEALYTLSLELYQSKETILKMYVNSIYFGNQVQGLLEASQFYFNLPPELLSEAQIIQLLATISSPTEHNPANPQNKKLAFALAQKLGLDTKNLVFTDAQEVKKNMSKHNHFGPAFFEIHSLFPEKKLLNSPLTLDQDLTKKIREITKRNIEELKRKNVKHGAVIVIKLPENEVLALVGSPNPSSFEKGYQINMLKEPRPIGSTIKPFIYLKAFEKGLRPYTLVEDREYKYITAIGFPLYPKNFDYKYRGEVSLHYALSNSLNVPAVKVLEYIGLENFYNFLEKDLEFQPLQELENYQLGIALGGLEMNLLDLARYFTIFPNKGVLKNLKYTFANHKNFHKIVAEEKYIQLINKILSDRKTGIEQFGLKSELNLFQQNYALKTGTSRDFQDSWVIGYTPDFLVGVWVGNPDVSSMDEVTGQLGAGRIWSETMELLLNSKYNKKTPFDFSLLKEFYKAGGVEYGLAEDNYEETLEILKSNALILNPHEGDIFLLEKRTQIILEAKENVQWFINGKFFSQGQAVIFQPQTSGQYQIRAENKRGLQEEVTILIR